MTAFPADLAVTGASIVAGRDRRDGAAAFTAFDAQTGTARAATFAEATPAEVDAAVAAAVTAFRTTRALPAAVVAGFLDRVAEEVDGLGDRLLDVASAETGLPLPRLRAERARTCEQLRSFSRLLREGWYVDAIIDPPDTAAVPIARPDVRRMLLPTGPVAVFGASNFPLAFGVAGGDTASALAAGCPVVVKGHPGHPETSELCGRAISAAVAAAGLPPGTFSLVQGRTHATGHRLVEAPGIAAVGFTGSERGGRALFDLAARRPVPIPVFAEMGSINPVVITRAAVTARGEDIAREALDSVLLGNGQFCTKPGLLLVPGGAAGDALVDRMVGLLEEREPACMVNEQVLTALRRRLDETVVTAGEAAVHRGRRGPAAGIVQEAALVVVGAQTVLDDPELMSEHFGPVSLIVRYASDEELSRVLDRLPGGLTATLQAEPEDVSGADGVLSALREKAGRLIWNGYPTGVSVTGAMHHGGPYPASTAAAHTSVGWTAIRRFMRPVAYQGVPDELLPPALQDANPLQILRLVDGRFTRAVVRR